MGGIKTFIERHFSDDVPISDRVCYLMCICGLITNIIAIISTISIGLPPVCIMISVASCSLLLIFSIIAFNTKHTAIISLLITVILGNILIPMMYITEGGQNGGMPFYFLLPAICIGFSVRKKFKYFVIIFSIIEYSLLIAFNFIHPQFIIPISEDSVMADSILACITCFLFIYVFANQYSVQLERDHNKIEQLNTLYREEANSDVLTGLYNRRYFNNLLNTAIPAIGGFNSLHLAMFDIDNFKSINDTFGHPEGDRVLKSFADILKQESISGIVPSRVGGEEFLLLIPYEDQDDAIAFTEYIVDRVRNEIKANGERQVTVSAGFQTYEKGIPIEDFLQAVDEKLYEAKTTGKNKVIY